MPTQIVTSERPFVRGRCAFAQRHPKSPKEWGDYHSGFWIRTSPHLSWSLRKRRGFSGPNRKPKVTRTQFWLVSIMAARQSRQPSVSRNPNTTQEVTPSESPTVPDCQAPRGVSWTGGGAQRGPGVVGAWRSKRPPGRAGSETFYKRRLVRTKQESHQ